MQRCKKCGNIFCDKALINGVCEGCRKCTTSGENEDKAPELVIDAAPVKEPEQNMSCTGCGKEFAETELVKGLCRECIEKEKDEQGRKPGLFAQVYAAEEIKKQQADFERKIKENGKGDEER